jgi:hypothetical protein
VIQNISPFFSFLTLILSLLTTVPKPKKSKSKRDDDDDDDDYCQKLTWGAIPEDEVDWFQKEGTFDSWQWGENCLFLFFVFS